MQHLTGEWFRQTLDALAGVTSSEGPQGYRRAPRVGVRTQVTLAERSECGLPALAKVILRDLSRSGVGLSRDRAMAPGARFELLLPLHDGRHLRVACVVRNCQRLAERVYQIGASFEDPPA